MKFYLVQKQMNYGHPLYWIASMASSFHFLTQFIRFYSLQFFNVISWILLSKNKHFVVVTVLLKSFYSLTFLDALYTVSFSWHFSFYQFLDCLIILTNHECNIHVDSDILAYFWTMLLREFLSRIFTISIFLNLLIKSFTNLDSSSLFLWWCIFYPGWTFPQLWY